MKLAIGKTIPKCDVLFLFPCLIIDGLIFLALRKSTDLTALSFLICNASSSQSYFCGVERKSCSTDAGRRDEDDDDVTRWNLNTNRQDSSLLLQHQFASSESKLVETLSEPVLLDLSFSFF